MSQDYIFNFSHGFERSSSTSSSQDQIRRDKLRLQGFEPPPTVGLQQMDEEHGGLPAVYDTGVGMLSEMFNFQTSGSSSTSAVELLANQMNYQHHHHTHRPTTAGDWYGNSAQAMQLFLTNPSHDQSPSSHHQESFGGSTSSGQGHFGHFTWVPPGGTSSENVGGVEGLSLSLSSSLQHLEGAKVEDLRIGDESGGAGMLYFNQVSGSGDPYRNNLHMQGGSGVMGPTHQPIHMGFGSASLGGVKVLRNSRYVKAAQELLEEFCSVGRGSFVKKNKSGLKRNNSDQNPTSSDGGGGGESSSKDLPSLSSAERIEHQRRKVKLSSMLDEVDRRYNHYCEQMQMVVNSFDLVMGFGAAVPYTALALKAMSRHFRCLKDAIAGQLNHTCELLGEKDPSSSGVTKGETPRLKLLEQSLRQQRAFQQMGMMEQEAWRPQRGLPERSVNILRAWLFEHFLHPYPSDADKHLLSRQTGLSRNQVSNWFINARVRLWKPMVEDMYQQESKEEQGDHMNHNQEQEQKQNQNQNQNQTNINYNNQHTNGPSSSCSSALPHPPMPQPPPPVTTTTPPVTRSEINDPENDPSILAINTQNCSLENQANAMSYSYTNTTTSPPFFPPTGDHAADIGSTVVRFGTSAGDVSLTLGLRHAGNLPETASFSVREFGEC
ncbi:hypothetical protein QVD17_18677 [Tagetes erecta]|uniref:Homeobox domain-containing protein n=1 Tax=Tagetes erecta TaxID=13708 RepID=A0AAD8NWK7_TARER|nr:hypothetical protein QVD17_18677 [Tagetes erecta]